MLQPLLLLLASGGVALATNHELRINEVMAGLNGDSAIQFVEIVVKGADQKIWGPGPHPFLPNNNTPVGRAMLEFRNATGQVTGRFVFPSHAPAGGLTVLIATQEFAQKTGIIPDFIMPKGVMANAGMVRFTMNLDSPADSHFDVDLQLAYGGASFTGSSNAGPPNANSLTILGAQSLRRFQNFIFEAASNVNADFQLGTPTPSSTRGPAEAVNNSVGETPLPGTFSPLSQVKQGETLFLKETFLGNGRTCATCHKPEADFGLTAVQVAALPPSDPLFVHEQNVNTLVVNSLGSINPGAPSGATQPSDFRLSGTITGTLSGAAQAVVLAGTGNTYQIIGGAGLNVLNNVISDANGNKGRRVSFTPGTLGGTNLENSTLMRGGRALILENINGFPPPPQPTPPPFMRGSPPLVNAVHTAPYGLSEGFDNLRTFSAGAVRQHFTRRSGGVASVDSRVVGVDFREATTAELAALEAFQQSLLGPVDGVFDDLNGFSRFATTEAQKRGRDLFFGAARCSVCHSGKALATSNGQFGTNLGVNQSFNTGVSTLAINAQQGLQTEQDIGQPANSRQFSTVGLFGVRKTAPYFHDHSNATLSNAILFYDSTEFRTSPAGLQIGPGNLFNGFTTGNVADIRAFLESLVDIPFTFTRQLTLLTRSMSGSDNVMTVTVTNTGTLPLTIIGNPRMAGQNAALFTANPVVPNPGPFSTGQTRSVSATLVTPTAGTFIATLEFDVSDGTTTYTAGAALTATADFIVHVNFTFSPPPPPDGTLAAPFPTVIQGNAASRNGNTIRIRGGNYPPAVTFNKVLRIEGTNGVVNIGR